MSKQTTTFARWTLATLLPLIAGCFVPVDDNNRPDSAVQPADLPKPGPAGVMVDSRLAFSSQENRPAAQWILQQASKDGQAGLDNLVATWPDVTLDLLRRSIAGEVNSNTQLAVAEAYDRQFGSSDPQANWSTAVTISSGDRPTYGRFRDANEQVFAMLGSGRFSDARAIDTVGALPTGAPLALRVEALRVAGLAALVGDSPKAASVFFAEGIQVSRSGPRPPQMELGLLLSESLRRIGNQNEAVNAWKSAVSAGATVHDPELWERAILAKTFDGPWPSEAAIAGDNEPKLSPVPDVGDVLIGVGKMRLDRGAPQAALLALSQAEAETPVESKKLLARLLRAQCLIALQQPGSALPMLESLANSPDPRFACRAQAIEGDFLCRSMDDLTRGIPMMQAGLDNTAAGDWPGKTRLVANLALNYLLQGNDKDGLRLLHLSQARFEADLQWDDLAYSLKNEAAYLRSSKNSNDADAVQKRANDICIRAGLPVGPLVEEVIPASDLSTSH
jgi:hypothetical protein